MNVRSAIGKYFIHRPHVALSAAPW